MSEQVRCPVKLNLTLRVMLRNQANYHEIFTTLWKKTADEVLTICPQIEENIGDLVETPGARIPGVNLVAKTLTLARRMNCDAPPLKVIIRKEYPFGSGIGAGSGNAAAMLKWLEERCAFTPAAAEISRLGADVSFLSSAYGLASAEGIGDIMTPLRAIPDYTAFLAFPRWRSETRAAYEALDLLRARSGRRLLTIDECRTEAAGVISVLEAGDKIGLLPNDFLEIFAGEKLTNYTRAFNIASEGGALAWGLCGSGSAVFALFANAAAAKLGEEKIRRLSWVKKTAKLE